MNISVEFNRQQRSLQYVDKGYNNICTDNTDINCIQLHIIIPPSSVFYQWNDFDLRLLRLFREQLPADPSEESSSNILNVLVDTDQTKPSCNSSTSIAVPCIGSLLLICIRYLQLTDLIPWSSPLSICDIPKESTERNDTHISEPLKTKIKKQKKQHQKPSIIPGLCGLANIGNTCFMNSAIQCLSNVPQLTAWAKDQQPSNHHKSVTHAYTSLIRSMWSGENSCVSPRDIKQRVSQHAPIFCDYAQKDSHEFMNSLLNALHSELEENCSSEEQTSIVTDLFRIQTESRVTCLDCDNYDPIEETTYCLPLPLGDEPTVALDTLVDEFLKEEQLDGEYYCSHCEGLRLAKQKTRICQPLPPVIIVQLKRFTFDETDDKLNTLVDYPIVNWAIDRNDSSLYDLAAVSMHVGDLKQGHYTTIARLNGSDQWYYFNDSSFEHIHDKNCLVNQNAYVMSHRLPLNRDQSFTSTYSCLNYVDKSQQEKSLSISEHVYFRVRLSYRNRQNIKDIYILENHTLEQLKDQIFRQLNLSLKPTDFSLMVFDERERVWVPIDDTNIFKSIKDLNLSSCAVLNVELQEEINTSEQHIPTIKDKEVVLKLCKQPMDKTDFDYVFTRSSVTVGQLKEQARKQVSNKRTDHLYLSTEDGWINLQKELDDLTLAEMGFNQYLFISFETEYDPIPGLCGLTNLGNTCFMNSALQCLSNIPELTQRILMFSVEMNAPIIGAYSTLIRNIWSGKHVVSTPSSLLLSIRENLPRFPRYRQHDAQEFMSYFLHQIHQELTSETTLITELFYGRIRSSVTCLGGCRSIENNEENISFLPLPIENDINEYNILYLRSNGEQRSVSLRACAGTIGELIKLFIEQYEPKLSSGQIEPVGIVDNRIVNRYSAYMLLNDTMKHQLTFIEVREKTSEQKYIEFWFLDRETRKSFRPPVLLVCPSYTCRYSHLIEQINCIENHLSSITNIPMSDLDHFYWRDNMYYSYPLKAETSGNDMLPGIDRITIEINPEWVQKYRNQYNFDRPSDKTSLNSLLIDFFHEEKLNGDYYCSKCLSLQEARQKTDLVLPLPPVLIIQLKRFTYDAYSDAKIDTYIEFPLKHLNLSEYIISNDENKTNISALYDLVAVSNHTGTLAGGHYTTYARNNQNHSWYSFNDETIRIIEDENDIVTKNAYILVYVKQSVQ